MLLVVRKSRAVDEIPFSAHEHIAAVDGHKVHLQDCDVDET